MAVQTKRLHFTTAGNTPHPDELDGAVRGLHDGSLLEDKQWDAFEAALCARLHASHAMFTIEYCETPAQRGFILHKHPSSRPMTIELRNALQLMRLAFATIPYDSPISLDELAQHSDSTVRSSCEAWLADASNPLLIALDVPGPENTLALLRFLRPRSHGDLTEEERSYLRGLLPHIRTAAGAFLRVQRLLAELSLLAEQLLPAAILLDASGAVVQMNEGARRLLAREQNLCVEHGRIKISHAHEARAFQDMLARAVRALKDGRGSVVDGMRIRRSSSSTHLWLVVRSLTTRHVIDPYRIAIMLYTQDEEPQVPLEALQHLLGLTRSETAVALRLARGKTVQEVTEDLGVSVSTTRTHLRSIFQKTCVDKQTKLVRTVLQGVAMLTCR